MAFNETDRFPDVLARGLVCGPAFSIRVVAQRSGAEQRNDNWGLTRWHADAATAVRTFADFQIVERWFYAHGGRLHGFRVRDPADFRHDDVGASPILIALNSAGDVVGTAGFGYGVPLYQLAKRYAATGSFRHDRHIRKPAANGVALTRGGSPVTLGAGAGNAAIASTTGRVTFVADQSRSISTHTPGSTHVLGLASAFSPNVSVGQRVYVSGCAGADAAEINALSWEVTAVSGANVTVALNSTGMTITGGTAALYPQLSEALAWTGTFDVPARFDFDRLDRAMLQRQASGDYIVSAPLPMVEDPNA